MTTKQLKAIEMLARAEQTQQDIAQELHLNPSTISRWKKDPVFMSAIVDRSKEILKENLPDVYKALSDRSKDGSDRHIKILLDHIEKLEEARSNVTQITFTWKGQAQDG